MPTSPYDGGTGGVDYTSRRTPPRTTPTETEAQRRARAQATADYYKSNPVGTMGAYNYTNYSYTGLNPTVQMPTMPNMPRRPDSGGSGGGGGGGGGAGGLTPEQQAALLRMAQNPAYMQFTPYQAPQYQQWNPAAMGTETFDAARRRIGTAAEGDRARVGQAYDPLLQSLQSATNPMANAQWATTPQLQNAYQRIIGNTNPLPQIAQENAYSMNSDSAFGNLMAVLAAQEQRNMASRVTEAQQGQIGALGNVDARASGMLGGVEMSQLQAQEADRLRRDQIAREEARYGYDQTAAQAYANWQAQMGINQGNVGIQNDALQTILQLIPGITKEDLLKTLALAAPQAAAA